MPDKRLASVKPSSVIKRMKKKDFARKVSRESILLCEQTGVPLEEFSTIAVEAMQSIAGELDL
jgi:predicted hydrolase (HD superfamily)